MTTPPKREVVKKESKAKRDPELVVLERSLKLAQGRLKAAEKQSLAIKTIEREMDRATRPLHRQIRKTEAPFRKRMAKADGGESTWTVRRDIKKIEKLIYQTKRRQIAREERRRLIATGRSKPLEV